MAIANGLLIAQVSHARERPKRNAFRYGVYYLCFPLSLQKLLRLPVLSLGRRFNLFSFRSDDHGLTGIAPETWMRGVLKEWDVPQADGEIVLLTLPRVLGHVFNPVSFWFCFDKSGGLRAVLSAVTNTYKDRHSYISFHDDRHVIGRDDWLEAQKIFYVSPFMEISGHYRFRFAYGEKRLGVWINHYDAEGLLLSTSVIGKRVPLTTKRLLTCFVRYPLVTFKVVGLIHFQALKLFFKGIRHHSRPIPPVSEISR